jgi:hypothetical protein
MSPRRAVSMLELVIVVALGSLIVIATALALKNAVKVWVNTSGRDLALREIFKAQAALQRDLATASAQPNHLQIINSPASLGGGADGHCLHWLSAVNGTTSEFHTLNDGSGQPYFFRNIFYYVTVPTDYSTLFSSTCVGGNEGGFDYNCPFKILVRGEEDQNPTFNPSHSGSQDVLLPGIAALLVRPTGFPRTTARKTVAINLLSLQATRNNKEISIDLRAVSIPDARRRSALGTTSYREGGFTVRSRFSVFLRN